MENRGRRAVEHRGGMRRFCRDLAADVVHYQWLTFPGLDAFLLPEVRPRVLTPHGWLRREAWHGRSARGLRRPLGRMDDGAALLRDEAGMEPARVRVIPHGAFDYLTRLPNEAPLPGELAAVEGPVIL